MRNLGRVPLRSVTGFFAAIFPRSEAGKGFPLQPRTRSSTELNGVLYFEMTALKSL